MATISLYVSGQTELGDVTEFFQKNLMNAGERPVAFFDGIFYESRQERVGNIVFQDYLIYSDKAVYLWARGANKDYLDRFTLGSVVVNSRNKDSDFATVNLKIRREGKEPVYVIFDMVERREAELITKLHSLVESTIEDALGVNYRKEIPDPVSARVFEVSRDLCPFQSFSLPLVAPPSMPHSTLHQNSAIGSGENLLEQYRASINYGSDDETFSASPDRIQAGSAGQQAQNPAAETVKGLENMLPTDPASLKRIASSIKDLIGEAPFKLREQVLRDLQHVPGDLATVLTALNELLANIAGNPQAERFVISAITAAVENDGVLGSISKMLRLTTGFGSGGNRNPVSKPAEGDADRRCDEASTESAAAFGQEDGKRHHRKKITIKDDPAADRERGADSVDDAPGMHRKRINVKAEEGSASAFVRDMMEMDPLPVEESSVSAESEVVLPGEELRHRKKINIVTDSSGKSEPLSGDSEASVAGSGVSGENPVTEVFLSEEELANTLGESSGAEREGPDGGRTTGSDTGLSGTTGGSVAEDKGDGSGEESSERTIKIKSTH